MWMRVRGNNVSSDLFLGRKWASHRLETRGKSESARPRVEEGDFPGSAIGEGVCLALPNRTIVSYGRGTRFPETETRRIRKSRKELSRWTAEKSKRSVARGCHAGIARCRQ